MPQRAYVPAAGHDWLLPLYDPFVKFLGGESAHRRLIDQAQPRPGQRVLEIGSVPEVCRHGSRRSIRQSTWSDSIQIRGHSSGRGRRLRGNGSPCSSIGGFRTRSPIRIGHTTEFSPPSCSTTSRRTRRSEACKKYGACSGQVAPCTCLILAVRTDTWTAWSPTCSTKASACEAALRRRF